MAPNPCIVPSAASRPAKRGDRLTVVLTRAERETRLAIKQVQMLGLDEVDAGCREPPQQIDDHGAVERP